VRALHWDIFCHVIDNFGDIGVTWRLARQLVAEHGLRVRLWVDDLESFRRIAPDLDPAADTQTLREVEIRCWRHDIFDANVEPADVVIEAFGCTLPEAYVERMAARPVRPVWVNLEYLSAEAWVPEHHRLPSPHPRLPLTRYFFFPGFGAGTGGLLRDRDLIRKRDAFQRDLQAQRDFWRRFGLAPAAEIEEMRISLFSYENPELDGLLAAWADGEVPVRCLVPEGRVVEQVAAFFQAPPPAAGATLARGRLIVQIIPFTDQDDYDRLLWACDLNFVRGEDSFVRAQWAARPLVWHIYPQKENAHFVKLEAFLAVYGEQLPATAARALESFWRAWNGAPDGGPEGESGWKARWEAFSRERPAFEAHARSWAKRLGRGPDLAAQLVEFVSQPQSGTMPPFPRSAPS